MKKFFYVLMATIILFSCSGENTNESSSAKNDNDTNFSAYKDRFIPRLWEMYPTWASGVGYHNFDSILNIPDQQQRDKELKFTQSELDSLHRFKAEELDDNNRTDYYLIENQLLATIWSINKLKAYEWDPSSYNLGSVFNEMLNNDYDSINNRLRNFYLRMKNIPAYYEAARKNISNPTAEHTQLAIEQNLGSVSIFKDELKNALERSSLPADEKNNINARAAECVNAITGYAEWLKKLSNDSPRTFRLGKDLYADKFRYDIMSAYSAEEMFSKAVEHKKELHSRMAEIARKMWPEKMRAIKMPDDSLKMIKMLIDKLSVEHVQPDSFQTAIEKQLKELNAFVTEKNLIYMDPSRPLVVRKEPDYMAGVAGASINAPGPYDKTGNTYYNVGSLSGWPQERAESYLREYNHYVLQILNIHEAIPGHYTQLVYSNNSPSLVKSILGNGAMVEGWAVYTERMMLEEGYGNNDPAMWLMYYKWNLRTTCNFILDYSVHTGDMSRDEAMKLLVDEAFQQQTEAENKWRRVQLTQVQLTSYFTGYTEIYEFREEMKKRLGDKFDLKQFHEKFLSYGSSPVKYIRELMLKDLSAQKVN